MPRRDESAATGAAPPLLPDRLPELDLEAIERQSGLLPPLPAVVHRLEALLAEGDADVGVVSRLVAGEASVVARILRIVNSAFYGIPRRIADVKLAVAYLGFRELHRIVLTASVAEAFRSADPARLERFWRHSYYTALVAKDLARIYERHLDPGPLWPAALLHDVGELVVVRLFPEHDRAVLRYQEEEGVRRAEAEGALGLPPHGEVGALLCRQWGLPASIEAVCRDHELDEPAPPGIDEETRASLRLVGAADRLVALVDEPLAPEAKDRCREGLRLRLGCGEDELLGLAAAAMDRGRDVDAFLADPQA